jgi:hypothetical protein
MKKKSEGIQREFFASQNFMKNLPQKHHQIAPAAARSAPEAVSHQFKSFEQEPGRVPATNPTKNFKVSRSTTCRPKFVIKCSSSNSIPAKPGTQKPNPASVPATQAIRNAKFPSAPRVVKIGQFFQQILNNR